MRKHVKHAISMENGIIFYSQKHNNHVAVATIDAQKNITTKWTTVEKYEKSKSKEKRIREKRENLKRTAIRIPLVVIFTIIWDMQVKRGTIYGMRVILLGLSVMLIINFLFNLEYIKNARRILRFHGAEHKVLNAYEELGRIPTIEEVKKFSRFSNRCGTNITTYVIDNILMIMASYINNPLRRLGIIIIINVVFITLVEAGCFNFLQRLNTSEPTVEEIKVAIEGLKVWHENE